MALINATAIPSGASYEIEQSLKLDDSKGSFLSRTPSSGGNRRTYTISTWIKRGTISNGSIVVSGANNNYVFRFRFNGAALHAYDYHGGSNQFQWVLQSNNQLRDTSAWYHVLLAVDTTQATNTNRIKMYVNGSQITNLGISNYPAQNYQSYINDAEKIWIGETISEDSAMDGYLAELNFIDGQALTPADFGETGTYGEWKPIEYEGTYGTNGFYLPFKQDYTVEGFSTVTYKGSAAKHYIGGVGFSPDLIWTKCRSTSGKQHIWVDKIRGGEKNIMSDSTEAENSSANRKLTLGAADGYVIDSNSGHLNESDKTYVSWNWDMGADTPTGFGCVTYKGGANNVSGFGFSPDLVWIKSRGSTHEHILFDTIRGATKNLTSVTSAAEWTNTGGLTAFEPDGFKLGSWNDVNSSSYEYVSWGWDMGNTTATNTSGSISSQVRANPTYGQSIVSYTGTGANATVGHGLTSAPEMMIIKRRSSSQSWFVYHDGIASDAQTDAIKLNSSDAAFDDDSAWNDTAPTNALFSLGSSGGVNQSSGTYIAYCFHSVSGYSKFGTYTGNASTTGPSVTTGFRPAFLMVKKSSDTGSWLIVDATRNPLGLTTLRLNADTTGAEDSSADNNVEFTNTGFQIKTSSGGWNASGQSFIYMAFAGGMDSISTYNTDGSIDTRVKASTTYGQSIVSWKGTGSGSSPTVGHGLNSAPEFVVVKHRDAVGAWVAQHEYDTTKYFQMQDVDAASTGATVFDNTAPTSSVFTINATNAVTNQSGGDYIAYCWHSVSGYSKIDSYSGNGSTTGPTITTGFRPAFILIKSTELDSWFVFDTTRSPGPNPINIYLNPDDASDESTTSNANIDILDTGFQLKTSHEVFNENGTTYIYMAFADKREYAYWLDQSGNNNDFTSNNLTESAISVDSPTNNFCTMNPLASGVETEPHSTAAWSAKEGNLESRWSGVASAKSYATIAPTDGKWYWEFFIKTQAETARAYVGLCEFEDCDINDTGQSGDSNYHLAVGVNSRLQAYGNEFDGVYPAPSQYDIYSIAIDWSASPSKFWFRINGGAWQGGGNPATGATPTKSYAKTVANASMMPYHGSGSGSSSNVSEIIFNFGQDSSFAGNKTAQGNQDSGGIGDFYYTPPTGFKALCTKNLPDVDVKPSEHFNTVLWTGNGSTNAISVGFKPDFVWGKDRVGTDHHHLFDILRGTNQRLISNATSAENTESNCLNSFDTNGFTLGSNTGLNANGEAHVAWNWKANGSGSSNTDGTINTTATSANVDSGFSIITYSGNGTSGATIGHGLSKAPEFFTVKRRSSGGDDWQTYYGDNTDFLRLNSYVATSDNAAIWNDTSPSSSVITLGNHAEVNSSGETYVCYAWHSVDGYSSVGTYTGNANADGTFVYTGFRPMWVMVKRTTSNHDWDIYDSKRSTFNAMDDRLRANDNTAEADGGDIDFTSNGFKLRQTGNGNGSGDYIYLAFAETPFKYSNAR
jgi:hypothetical protein